MSANVLSEFSGEFFCECSGKLADGFTGDFVSNSWKTMIANFLTSAGQLLVNSWLILSSLSNEFLANFPSGKKIERLAIILKGETPRDFSVGLR